MKYFCVLFLAAITVCGTVSAQKSFEVPKDLKLDKPEDYAHYNKDITGAVQWLETTPLSVDVSKRKQVSAFLLMWIINSPDVSITVGSKIIDYVSDPADLNILYMGGWARHVIDTKDTTMLGGNLAGIRTVLQYYKGRYGVPPSAKLDKLVKLDAAGKLSDYIASIMKE